MDISDTIWQSVELWGKIVAAIAGLVLAIIKTRDTFDGLFHSTPVLRKSIRADLEILKMMESTEPGYVQLRDHIKNQIEIVIKQEEKRVIGEKDWGRIIRNKMASRNWGQIIIGLAMSVGFGYWTYIIAIDPQRSNWWIILTDWMTLAGIGFLLASEKKAPGTDPPQDQGAASAADGGESVT